MNKKLVAVAIGGLLAAPLAQAQTANVTLYGRLNMSMDFVNGKIVDPVAKQPTSCTTGPNAGSVNGCLTVNPTQYRVSSNSSRFGLRGTESLGGGVNAIFQVESSVNPDNGSGTLAGRDSFLGFQGSWGTFRIGRFHAPYDDLSTYWGSNPTLITGILSTSSVWAQGFASKQNGGFDDRVCNSVRWDSPIMSGFQINMQYGNGPANGAEGTTATSQSNSGVYSGALQYNNGPIGIAGGFQQNIAFRGRGLNDLAWSVSGSYQFPKVKVGISYESLSYDYSVNTLTGAKTDLTRNWFGVGITVDAGPGQIYGSWQQGADGKGSSVTQGCLNGTAVCPRIGGLAGGNNSSVNAYEISYTYPLSKRTSVYAGYVKVANDSNASYNFGVNSYANTAIGARPQGLTLGAWHNF